MITIRNIDTGYTVNITPSEFQWSRMRVSSADSGRDYSGTMHVGQITQKIKLEVKVNGYTWQEGASLLQALDSEYVSVTYPDMLTGTFQTKTFYTGDREAPVYLWWDNKKILSTISFNLIEQ